MGNMIVTGHDEKKAEYYNDIYRSGYDTAGYIPLYQLIIKMLKNISSPRILELGCGIGDLAGMIIEEGYPYRGFDFSETAIDQCKALCPSGNFQVGDIYNADNYQPVDYSTVIALEVLEHVDDLKVMEDIPAGARLIASVPDYDDAAHLRLYRDIQIDIIERFRPYLHVVEVATATSNNAHSGVKQSIHIFSGIKILP
jgi:2-polyprenyl-3-methyl-5-hydroxy-6-metoxy-1,4-benzoquinol methylase